MKSLKYNELAELIKIAGTFGVRELRIGQVRVSFGEKIKSTQEATANQTKEAEIAMQNVEADALQDEQFRHDKEQLEFDVIEDPVGYERKLLENELEDDNVQH